MRCQIFRQIVQKFRRHTDVCRGIFVQDDGKYASRCGAKPQGGLCAVLPLVICTAAFDLDLTVKGRIGSFVDAFSDSACCVVVFKGTEQTVLKM